MIKNETNIEHKGKMYSRGFRVGQSVWIAPENRPSFATRTEINGVYPDHITVPRQVSLSRFNTIKFYGSELYEHNLIEQPARSVSVKLVLFPNEQSVKRFREKREIRIWLLEHFNHVVLQMPLKKLRALKRFLDGQERDKDK